MAALNQTMNLRFAVNAGACDLSFDRVAGAFDDLAIQVDQEHGSEDLHCLVAECLADVVHGGRGRRPCAFV